jgi:hypothetical protein
MAQVDRELLRVATADVGAVDVGQRVEHLDRREDASAPPLEVRGGDTVEDPAHAPSR